MKTFNPNTINNDTWLTPPLIIKALGDFDLDPCSPIGRPWDTAKQHYTKEDNGFIQKWEGRVWLNPPYGKETFRWVSRLADHGKGVALIFARTETKGFHEHVFAKAHAVFFFKGRLSFYRIDGTKGGSAGAPSVLVSFSEEDTASIEQAQKENKLNGYLIKLRE